VAFIKPNIMTKTITDRILRVIPRVGFNAFELRKKRSSLE